MAILGGVKPSELDATTISALNAALGSSSQRDVYGAALPNIRRKLRTMSVFGKPKDSIRVTLFADSIWASSSMKQDLVDWLLEEFEIPNDNVDVNCCWGGYSVLDYIPCLDGSVLNPNIDLFIFSEYGGTEYMDQMLAIIRSRTNADIVLGTWTLQTEAMGRPRYWELVDLARRYDCELHDVNALLLNKLADGTLNPMLTSPDSVHLSAAGAEYVFADFVAHFQNDRYYNEYINGSIREDIFFLGAEVIMPVNGITLNGSWTKVDGAYPETGIYAASSTIDNYIEITFTGIGFEAVFATNAVENVHNVLIDSAAPSAYVSSGRYLEYCTQIIGKTQTNATWYFHRFFAAYVTAPFMTNDEEEVEFEIVLGAPTRDGEGVLTTLPYTLKQGDDTLGTGDIFEDSTFTFRTTGEITIPATVYSIPNYKEASGYPFTEGDTMQFFARKTWKDSIDTNTETYLRVAGLARGEHILRITKADSEETKVRYISIYK